MVFQIKVKSNDFLCEPVVGNLLLSLFVPMGVFRGPSPIPPRFMT